ncbi:ATP-binding protein [bacterium]|nr:ATP-binding protein [bacterium]
MYVPREIEPLIKRASSQFPAIALTGARQSGKTTLVKKIFPDFTYVTFDDPLQQERAIEDPNLFLDSLGDHLILDEIQHVPDLMPHLKIRIDQNRNKRGRFILTGSQQFNLIRNLSESLAGRIVLLELQPFSTGEKRIIPTKRILTTTEMFIDNCIRGTYPELTVYPDIESELWYGSYLQTYLERDIRTIYDIGSLRDFRRLMQVLAGRNAQVLNMSTLAKSVGIAVSTVKKWISILEASNIIYLLQPYHNNFGKRITKAPKLYFLDCGLVCYLTGLKDPDHIIKGPMAGSLFESLCVQESLKVFFNCGRQPKLFYLRTNNGLEVDLIIETENMTVYPLEIKLTKSPKRSMISNIARFRSVFAKLKIKQGRLLCLCDEQMPLTPNDSVEPCDIYLDWLRKTIGD